MSAVNIMINPRVLTKCYLCHRMIKLEEGFDITTGNEGHNLVVKHLKCRFREYKKRGTE